MFDSPPGPNRKGISSETPAGLIEDPQVQLRLQKAADLISSLNTTNGTHSKPLEGQESSAGTTAKQDTSWLENNIANPIYNTLYVGNRRLLGDLTNSDWLKNVQEAEVKPAAFLEQPLAYSAQHLSSGLAGVIPYVFAGKLMGGLSRSLAGTVGLTGLTARVLASETTAQITGAAVFDSLRTPVGSETRLGNAFAGATAFAMFEGGNHLSLNLSFLPRLAMRGLTGVVGASTQLGLAHDQSELSVENIKEAAQSGAFMNIFLPPVQRAFGDGIDLINSKIGREAPIQRHAPRFGLEGKSAELNAQMRDNPLARVRVIKEGDPNIDHHRNIVATRNPSDPAELTHELAEKQALLKNKPEFETARQLLQSNPEGAQQQFIETCLKIELSARNAEAKCCREAGIQRVIELSPDAILKSYGNQWNHDFQNFKASGGTRLPEIGFSKPTEPTESTAKPETPKLELAKAKEFEKTMNEATLGTHQQQVLLDYLRANSQHQQAILNWLTERQQQIHSFYERFSKNPESPPQAVADYQRYVTLFSKRMDMIQDFYKLGLTATTPEAAQKGLTHSNQEIQTDAALTLLKNLHQSNPDLRQTSSKILQENLSKTTPDVQEAVANHLKTLADNKTPETQKTAIEILSSQLGKSAPQAEQEIVQILGDHLDKVSNVTFAKWKLLAPDNLICGQRINEILSRPEIRNLPPETLKTFLSKQRLDGNHHQETIPEPASAQDLANAPEWARKQILESKAYRDSENKMLEQAGRPERLTVNPVFQRRAPGPSDVVGRLDLMDDILVKFGPDLGPQMIQAAANNRAILSDITDSMKLPENPRNAFDTKKAEEKANAVAAAFEVYPELGIKLLKLGVTDRAGMQEILNAVGHPHPNYRGDSLVLLHRLLPHTESMDTMKFVFRMVREGYQKGAFNIAKQQVEPNINQQEPGAWQDIQDTIRALALFNRPRPPRVERKFPPGGRQNG